MANAPLSLNPGRQYPLVDEQVITAAELNETGVAVKAIRLPVGAVVVGGAVVVDTAFDAATAVLDVGDVGSANRYKNDVNIAATGYTALVPTGYVSDGSPITITPVYADAVTVGRLRLQVHYIVGGRANEAQP